jgi:ABC-2 type transport system permease protein
MNLYNRWFSESLAIKVSETALRCFPILIIAFLLPPPFRMTLPSSLPQFLLFLASAPLGLFAVTAYCIIDCTSIFFTMSRYNVIFVILADFLSGGYIPIPFFPEPFRTVAEYLPFAAMQNMPLRIYSGDIAGMDAMRGIGLQLFWITAMLLFGKWLMRCALRRVIAQGG